jgi:hypothetical protein
MPLVDRPKCRRPWDSERSGSLGKGRPIGFDKDFWPEPAKPRAGHRQILCLRGLYVFTPSQLASDDLRQFLGSGLRVLRAEARARGLSEEQVYQLLISAFDVFHDTAESMWTALKSVMSQQGSRALPATQRLARADRFVACEEDRPVPVVMDYREPLTLLDPDAALSASEE